MVDLTTLMTSLGITVVPVETLNDPACFVESQDVVLVRRDLGDDECRDVLIWMLDHVLHSILAVGR